DGGPSSSITAGLLTTSSATGTILDDTIHVASFNGTNTNSNSITLHDDNPTLNVTGIIQAGSGAVDVTNTGAVTTTGRVMMGVPTSGLQDWYTFDGTTSNATSATNPGVVTGTEQYAPGEIGQAFNFNGSTQVLATNPSNDLSTSYAFWFNTTQTSPA